MMFLVPDVMNRDDIKALEDALRESDRRREEYLAMLAHELRNPLAPIRNAVEILRRVEPKEPNVAWACSLVDRQIGYLTRLIDELLDVSRILRGRIALKKELVDLGLLVKQAADDVKEQMHARQQTLFIKQPVGPVLTEGDWMRLLQVVEHLLGNAAKYTDSGGYIVVEVQAAETEGIIRVRDNGIGLSAELLPRIFDLFTQGERALDRSQGGLGIGLTLVKQILELHNGRIEAHSDGPGQGTEFIVHLPRWIGLRDRESGRAEADSVSGGPPMAGDRPAFAPASPELRH
jgi:signal transduction histidine kinase